MFYCNYNNVIVDLMEEIWRDIPKDLHEDEVIQVIGSLMARQVELGLKLAKNIDLWEWNVGPLILRSMTDCCITLLWILKSPNENSRKYISSGLGQIKLEIEHYKEILEDLEEEDKVFAEKMIEMREIWHNSQHYTFLQEVDVGSWSGMSTRKMAEHCNCSDLYKFAYKPYSNCAHNSWSHVGLFNSSYSEWAFHKYTRVPTVMEWPIEPDIFMNSAKYVQKVMDCVIKHYDLNCIVERPYNWAANNINELLEKLYEKHSSK